MFYNFLNMFFNFVRIYNFVVDCTNCFVLTWKLNRNLCPFRQDAQILTWASHTMFCHNNNVYYTVATTECMLNIMLFLFYYAINFARSACLYFSLRNCNVLFVNLLNSIVLICWCITRYQKCWRNVWVINRACFIFVTTFFLY